MAPAKLDCISHHREHGTDRPPWLMGPLSFLIFMRPHLPADRNQQISDAIGAQALEDQFLLLVLPAIGQAHVLKLVHPGETESGPRMVLVQVPDGPVKAVAVMFPGGDGRIGVSPDGSIGRIGNFLIRTRAQWVARGLMFAAVDAAFWNRVGRASLIALSSLSFVCRSVSRTSSVVPTAIFGISRMRFAPRIS